MHHINTPEVDMAVIESFECRKWLYTDALIPSEMVGAICVRERLREVARTSPNGAILNGFDFDEMYGYIEYPDDIDLDPLSPNDELVSEYWLGFMERLYKGTGGALNEEGGLGDADDEGYAAIFELLTSPTAETVAKSKTLQTIPNVIEIAKAFEACRRQKLSELILDDLPERIVLNADILPPAQLADDMHGIQVWVNLVHDNSGIPNSDMHDMSLWTMTATFYKGDEDGIKSELIAVVSGELIGLFKDHYKVHPDSLYENLDAHSCYLNDVWKVIVGEFLPQNKFNGLDDFYSAVECFQPGIAVVNVEINPKYRGLKLTPFLLNELNEIMRAPEEHDILSPLGKSDDNSEFDRFIETYEIKFGGGIGLFVFAVEGKQPKDNMEIEFANILLSRNPSRLKKPKVLELNEEERKRIKLTQYFNSIQNRIKDAFLIVYNPWDYPIT